MNRRSFLTRSLLVPAALTLSGLPALAGTSGSTLVQAPGLSASGAFDIPDYTPGTTGRVNMAFTNGPRVNARFGPRAVEHVTSVAAGDSFSVLYTGFNQAETLATTWTVQNAARAAARADFTVENGLSADASAVVGGDQYEGAGVAALIVAAMSAGSVLRGSGAGRLQAMVTARSVPGSFAFGLEVTVRNA
jgi:hypothetical protein